MAKKRIVVLGVTGALVLAVVLFSGVALAQSGTAGAGRGAGGYRGQMNEDARGPGGYRSEVVGDRGGSGSGTLDPQEEQALRMAIDDEYKALATYLGVMEQFGQVSPFAAIARAEEQHIAALENLFARYGLEVPVNEWSGNTPTFASVADACVAGAEAEIENAALYDQLFSMVDNPDIVRVFTNLRNASQYNHLPAFSSCADGDGAYDAPSVNPSER